MASDRTSAWRSLYLQILIVTVGGFAYIAIAYDLPLIWAGTASVVGAASAALSVGVAKGLILVRRGSGRWDFETMQPRGGSQLRPAPHVDWAAHGKDRAFLHIPNLSRDDLRFICSAQCLVLQSAVISNLDALRGEASIWERNGADLYAEFDKGPKGSASVEGARVWASERNGVSRIVVAYGGVNGEISQNTDGRADADPVLQAASSREWFETIVKFAAPGDAALLSEAERASLTSEESIRDAYNAGYAKVKKIMFWLLLAFFVFGFGLKLLFEPVLHHFNLSTKDADRGGGALVVSSRIANEWARTSPHTGAESFRSVVEGVERPDSVTINVRGNEVQIRSSTDECVVRAEDDTYASVSCHTL